MELEQLEALAFGSQQSWSERADAQSGARSAAAANLVAGTQDYDYFVCIRAQQARKFAEAQTIIDAWPNRYGRNQHLARLENRQMLLRWRAAPTGADALALARHMGVDLQHEPADRPVDESLPSVLDAALLAPAALLQTCLDDYSLNNTTDYALPRLLRMKLTEAQRNTLLDRLPPTTAAALIGLVVDDVKPSVAYFGRRNVHSALDQSQLTQLAQRVPALLATLPWWCARWTRMRPPSFVQWPARSDARAAYLASLYADTATLPSVFASVKLWLLSHLLVEELRHNRRNDQLFLEFMDQRNAELRLDQQSRDDGSRRSMVNQAAEALGLPAQTDLDIIGLYLQAYIEATGAVPPAVAARIEQAWLARYVAEQRLLLGKSTNDNDARVLGASAVAALAARTQLELCAHNPTSFAAAAPVALAVDIKNIDRVTVKVYRIDPIAYFAATGRAVGIELDLDGITASYEDTITLSAPQIQRTRHTFALPSCARAGTYIVEVIGGGIASRTLLNKGRLRCLARPSAAGTVVAVFDSEAVGADIQPIAGTKLWLAGLELVADDRHEIVVPLGFANQTQTALAVAGDVATVLEIPRYAENMELAASIMVAREHLAAGKRVRAVADVTLQIAGVSASLALLRNTRWELTLRAVDGTVTTKAEPLTLADGDRAVLEWKLPDDIAAIEIAITATCDRQIDRSAMQLRTLSTMQLALPPHDNAPESDPIHDLFLLRHQRGIAIACLGRNGEPAANRPVELTLQHRYSSDTVDVTLQTDAHGQVELGAVGELVKIDATVGDVTRSWTLPQPQLAVASRAGVAGTPIVLPILTSALDATAFAAQLPYAALVERRGGAVLRHVAEPATWRAGAIVLPALAAGDYQFVMPGIATVDVTVLPATALQYGEFIGALETTLQQPELLPRVVAVACQGRRLRVDLAGVDASTAMHVIVTQFAVATTASNATTLQHVATERAAPPQSYVINGRDVGDEVRYVFDRKHAPRRPSPLLDKPSLLANPWARQATVTNTMAAAPGMAMPREAPAPAMYAMRKMAKEAYGANDESLASYGFVASSASSVVANVELQISGTDASLAWADVDLVEIPGAAVRIVVSDRRGTVEHDVYLAAQPLQLRDLRLSLAIAPDRHVAERRKIDVTAVGQPLLVRDAATAKIRVVETVEKLFGYLSALRTDIGLADFAFVTTWHSQSQAAKLDLYHRFACHELHLFLYFKDATFFASVVMPLLRSKRRKTFIDAWLLNLPLTEYAAPAQFEQLNACERALLAHRVPNRDGIVRALADDILANGKDGTEPRRVAAMLLGAALDDDDALASLQQNAIAQRESARGPYGGAALGASRSEVSADLYEEEATGEHASYDEADDADDERSAPKKRAAKPAPSRSMEAGAPRDVDRARRAQPSEPVFAVLDKTQEWAESNWWRARPSQNADLITANAFWRAVASCPSDGLRQFISADVGLCTDSLAAALCALALTDVPFVAAAPTYSEQQGDIAVTTAAPALLASAQLLDSSVAEPAAVVLVQNYLQANQRTEWVDGESREVYVVGDLTVGVPYIMQVVVSNASAQAVRGEVLMQIPRGAITLTAGGATLRPQLDLAPYTTTTFEGVFYFPAVGDWTHFPAHATANGNVLGAAEARPLRVVPRNSVVSSENWDDLANRVALPVLLEYLRTRPLGPNQQLDALAWRLRERAGYNAIITALEQRCRFDETLWGYALAHGDEARALQLFRHKRLQHGGAPDVGPAFDDVGLLDNEDCGSYEHLEFAPLVSARAHALRGRNQILNQGLAQQYRKFLELVAHRAEPTANDRLAAAHYLLAADRIDDGARMFATVDRAACTSPMQYDYMAAYLAICAADVAAARQHIAGWTDCAVPRWARRFAAITELCDELLGGVSTPRPAASPDAAPDRAAQLARAAQQQPTCAIEPQRDGIVVTSQNLAQIELRFFAVDAELLFSKAPFAQADVARFAFVEPTQTMVVRLSSAREVVPWPTAVAGRNVVVEARGPGISVVRNHYANDLSVTVTHNAGRLRVVRATDQTPRPAAYVKAYGRGGNGVAFYKDGYTDLRGWFDYASLSTDDLDRTQEFSILVVDEQCGATVVGAKPPLR